MKINSKLTNLSTNEIQRYLKLKGPYFFLDNIEEVILGRSVHGYKKFTHTEWFFPLHFENDPNVPALVQLEILKQAFLMMFLPLSDYQNKSLFITNTRASFKRKILPEEELFFSCKVDSIVDNIVKGVGICLIKGEQACQMQLELSIQD